MFFLSWSSGVDKLSKLFWIWHHASVFVNGACAIILFTFSLYHSLGRRDGPENTIYMHALAIEQAAARMSRTTHWSSRSASTGAY